MLTTISKARVVNPALRIEKAIATIETDEETGASTLLVLDRRSREELLRMFGSSVQVDRTTYQFTEAESGDVTTVSLVTGCGCGGTKVTHLSDGT